MKKILVYNPEKKREEKNPIKNRLMWYDLFYSKMLTFEGTKLVFEYVEEEFVEMLNKRIPADKATEKEKKYYGVQKKYIVRPKVEIHFKKTIKKEKKKDFIKKWFDKYQKYNHTDIQLDSGNVDHCIFSVPDKEVIDFENELYRERLNYE